MPNIRAFVRPDDTTTITCPGCNKSKNVTVTQFRDKKHTLHVTCSCRKKFSVNLDFRSQYRKKVNLSGTYRIVKPPGGGYGEVHIQNISWDGIGFTVFNMPDLRKGQVVELTFKLDDRRKSKLVKQVRICSVIDNYVGSEFSDKGLYEKSLGFYLRA